MTRGEHQQRCTCGELYDGQRVHSHGIGDACRHPYNDAHSHRDSGYGNSDSYGHCHCYRYGDRDADLHGNSDPFAFWYCHGYANPDRNGNTNRCANRDGYVHCNRDAHGIGYAYLDGIANAGSGQRRRRCA